MSNEMAVAAVTLALRDLLSTQMKDKMEGAPADVNLTKHLAVTMLPPNKVRDKHPSENVINIYVYRTEVNAAWRNQPLKTQSRPGEAGWPPLALNVEYLISAYGEDDGDLASQFLLAQAMLLLHDRPVIARERLRLAFESAHVHDQIESVTVTPRAMSLEEVSKLWSVFQTQYRLSAAYVATVLLIESRRPTRSALPVLRRGPEDRGPRATTAAPPILHTATPRSGFGAVRLDEEIVVTGENFSTGALTARFRRLPFGPELSRPVTIEDATHAVVRLPAAADAGDDWRAGFYALSFVVVLPDLPPWTTNEVSIALAPSITVSPATHGLEETIDVTITAVPRVAETQTAIVIYGSSQVTPKSITTPADTAQPTTVVAEVAVVAGKHPVRLRVDGVDSVPIVTTGGLPAFDPQQSIEV